MLFVFSYPVDLCFSEGVWTGSAAARSPSNPKEEPRLPTLNGAPKLNASSPPESVPTPDPSRIVEERSTFHVELSGERDRAGALQH